MRDCVPGSHAFDRNAVACRCGAVTTAKESTIPRCGGCGSTHWNGAALALVRYKGKALCANCRAIARAKEAMNGVQ